MGWARIWGEKLQIWGLRVGISSGRRCPLPKWRRRARFQNGGRVPSFKMAALPSGRARGEDGCAPPPLPKGPSGQVGRDGCFLPFCLRKALLKMAPWGGGMRPWCSSWVRAAIATVMGPLRMHPPKQTKKKQTKPHVWGHFAASASP